MSSSTATPGRAEQRPRLSIVIPLYQEIDNVEPLLTRVHEGLADYRGDWELICVDDGSRVV